MLLPVPTILDPTIHFFENGVLSEERTNDEENSQRAANRGSTAGFGDNVSRFLHWRSLADPYAETGRIRQAKISSAGAVVTAGRPAQRRAPG